MTNKKTQHIFRLILILLVSGVFGFFIGKFIGGFAKAQETTSAISAEAQVVLDKAIEAHGGQALLNYIRAKDEVLMSFYAPNGQVAGEMTGIVQIDIENGLFSSSFLQGETVVVSQIINEDGTFSYSPQTGALKLPPAQAKELKASLYTGMFMFRQLELFDSISYAGEDTFEDITGERLDFEKDDAVFSFLFNEAGLMVASKIVSGQLGEVTSITTKFDDIEGITMPSEATSYAMGTKVFAMQSLSSEVNPEFGSEAFVLPE